MADKCIPVPIGGNPIVWHMDVGDRLRLKNLKYGGNQQVYVTCGPQVAETCACSSVSSKLVAGEVTMKGKLGSGARLAVAHDPDTNTAYKSIDLTCRSTC